MAIARGAQRTARELQQELGSLFGARNITTWDVYTSEDREYLVRKIHLLIPDAEGDDKTTRRENAKLAELRECIATAAWNQRKYNGGDLLMSIVYVLCTKITKNEIDALEKTEYSMYSLLRIRKCRVDQDSENCCMIFIDNNGRVYQNWDAYLQNNTLPEGVIVAPQKGCYSFSIRDEVLLECIFTPASSMLSKAANVANTAAGVVGLGAGVITIAALASPVVAPLAAGAAVAGIGSGIWGTATSYFRLRDRSAHEESIDLSNTQARAEWLGVAGGVLGMGASGATSFMARSAAAGGNIPNITRGVVTGLNIAALLVNGTSVGNSAIQMILNLLNGEDAIAMDVLQLGASLFLVTHSVSNFRIATQIVNSSRENAIGSARRAICNRQTNDFNRMYRETIALRGEQAGQIDVLRALNNMPNPRQPLKNVNRVNTQLRQNSLRAAFHPDGRILLNDDLVVESGILRQNLQHGIGENIAQRVAPAQPVQNVENINVRRGGSQNIHINQAILITRRVILDKPTSESVRDEEVLLDTVHNILEYISAERLNDLYVIANDFWQAFSRQFGLALGRFIPLEEVLWRCFLIARDEARNMNIEDFILDQHASFFILKLKSVYESLLPRLGARAKCTICPGFFEIVEC